VPGAGRLVTRAARTALGRPPYSQTINSAPVGPPGVIGKFRSLKTHGRCSTKLIQASNAAPTGGSIAPASHQEAMLAINTLDYTRASCVPPRPRGFLQEIFYGPRLVRTGDSRYISPSRSWRPTSRSHEDLRNASTTLAIIVYPS